MRQVDVGSSRCRISSRGQRFNDEGIWSGVVGEERVLIIACGEHRQLEPVEKWPGPAAQGSSHALTSTHVRCRGESPSRRSECQGQARFFSNIDANLGAIWSLGLYYTKEGV